jgi:hypothetical protein
MTAADVPPADVVALDEARAERDALRRERLIHQASVATGASPWAAPDVEARLERAGFKLEGDALVARDKAGCIVLAPDGRPLTPERFLSELREAGGAHLFDWSRRPAGWK